MSGQARGRPSSGYFRRHSRQNSNCQTRPPVLAPGKVMRGDALGRPRVATTSGTSRPDSRRSAPIQASSGLNLDGIVIAGAVQPEDIALAITVAEAIGRGFSECGTGASAKGRRERPGPSVCVASFGHQGSLVFSGRFPTCRGRGDKGSTPKMVALRQSEVHWAQRGTPIWEF